MLINYEYITATHVFVRLNATLSQTEPQPRTDVVQLHRLDETVEGGGWVAAVQQLDAHVVKGEAPRGRRAPGDPGRRARRGRLPQARAAGG